jgi:L-lactate dehydrogenase
MTLVKITKSIIRNENSILPVSTLISDYYGVDDVCISIPSIVNINGVGQSVKIDLSVEEEELFRYSANTLKQFIQTIELP